MQLIIEYVLEGTRRGYNFTTPTHGISEDLLKTIWRAAMPRGQGWGAPIFTDSVSLKCFPVNPNLIALSTVIVTEMRDESGRAGIRRATIDLMSVNECSDYLHTRLVSYPANVQAQVESLPTLSQRKHIIDRSLPKMKSSPQVILSRPYQGYDDWQIVEMLILKLALARTGPMRRWGKIIPFTTLALDYHEESNLVALPTQQVSDKISTIEIP